MAIRPYIKRIELELNELEFTALEDLLSSLDRELLVYGLGSLNKKVKAIRQRIDTARKLSEKFPIREG